MLTPDSSAAPYLGAADFLALKDWREAGALCYDDDTTDFLESDVLAHPALAKALMVASGQLEAAALRGGRYAVADLQALSGASLAFLQGVLAPLAFQRLRDRRGGPTPPTPEYERALGFLADLSSGAAVLAFAESAASGLPRTAHLSRRDRAALGLPSTVARMTGIRGRGPCRS